MKKPDIVQQVRKTEGLIDYLQSQIIGQDEVLMPFANVIQYGYCRLNTPGRPRGTLLLLGPTGTGKTESVRAAVEYLYGTEANFLRLDMSEFSRQAGEEALTNLIGRPGGKDCGRLGAFLKTYNEGFILYDEIEKAHPQIFTILLQQLDAARITLSDNRTYDLSNFFLIATSNIGAMVFSNIKHLSEKRLAQSLEIQLKERFSPEFVARWGQFGHEILMFRPLKPEHLRLIARKFFVSLLPQYRRHDLIIEVFSADAVEAALRTVDNTRNGARDLRGSIERMVRQCVYETITSTAYIARNAAWRGVLDLDDSGNNFTIRNSKPSGKEFYSCP